MALKFPTQLFYKNNTGMSNLLSQTVMDHL